MASVIVVGRSKNREVSLEDAVTVIGRDGGASIELGDLQVSRRHALLVRATEGFFVKDLGSRNGVLLNQRRIPPRQQARLRNGDVLSLGKTTIVFKDIQAGDAEPQVPTLVRVPAPPVATPTGGSSGGEPAGPATSPVAAAPGSGPAASPRRPAPGPRGPSGRAAGGIPRALPAAGAGRGGADVLLRALERAETERVFYRNLLVGLAGVVLLTFVVLLGWALSGGGRAAPTGAATQDEGGAQAATVDPGRAGATDAHTHAGLDPVAFGRDVQPVLAARCASCHSVVGGGGGLLLAQSGDPRTVEANLWAVRRFVQPGRPQESALLLKPLPAHEGGPGHGGGDVLTMTSPEWAAMAAWVAGGPTPREATPPSTAADEDLAVRIDLPGAEVPVGRAAPLRSAPDAAAAQGPLSYRWALRARPAGSAARIERPAEAQAELVPDRPGTYVVMLVVHDGKASGSAEATLVAVDGAGGEAPPGTSASAAAPSTGPAAGPAGARAFQALVGRAPTADEARGLEGLAGDALVKALLERPEPYRAWWEAELEHLGLTGEHRPKGATWDSVPERLRASRITAVDALQALLFSQAWASRHAGREAYVAAVLERVLGLDGAQATAARGPAERLHDGHEAELFGRKGESQADLVRIAGQDERARRALLARAHRRVTGRAAPPDVLEPAVARAVEAPADVFRILARWASE
ncbi:MAG: FHA domain-containing protein [Planctomycetes bacterium]|nr:FHA domain-containing protein [Planctomycetota bacterium]